MRRTGGLIFRFDFLADKSNLDSTVRLAIEAILKTVESLERFLKFNVKFLYKISKSSMSNKTTRLYEFDNFRADPLQKCLWFGTDLVSLTPKAFETLLVLIEHKGRVVDKETILNRVWENTFVEESTLTQNISTLRKTLDSLQNGKQFIETVPRRGYRFVGNVHEIIGDEEIVVLESHTKTEIVAEQEIIHDSADAKNVTNLQPFRKSKTSFLTTGKTLVIVGTLVCLAVLIGVFAPEFYLFQPKPSFDEKFKQIEITKLASSGDISKIAISPDGKFIALVEKKNDLQTLFLRQIGNPKIIEIIPPTKDEFIGVTFSPDSEFIYYAAYQKFEATPPYSLGILYKVPILGGTRQEMAKDVDSPIAFSPADDKKFAFVRQNPSGRESSIVIFDCAGGGEVKLTSRKWRERFSSDGLSFSPDGKFLASAAFNSENSMELVAINTENSDQKSLLSEDFKWIGQVSWLKDGSGIAFALFTESSPNLTDEIWLASFPDGKLRRITNGVNGFYGIGTTADSDSIMSVKSNRVSNLAIASGDDLQDVSIVNKSIGDNTLTQLAMVWTPDGKIVYTTSLGGNSDIWLVNPDGTNPIQLTANSQSNTEPIVSMDGKYLFFISNRTNTQNIWRMNLDGTNLKQMTNLPNVGAHTISPDGKTVYFTAENSANQGLQLWEIVSDGGEPKLFSQIPIRNPQISPDGKFIVCLSPEQNNVGKKSMITVISVAEKEIVKQFENPFKPADLAFSWRADGKAFSYKLTQNGVSNIWLQNLEENSPKQITNFSTDEIFRFAWSKTDNRLAFEKGTIINEVILIKNLPEK